MNIKCFLLEDTGKMKPQPWGASPLYKRYNTGEEMTWEEAPAGAMMFASWMEGITDYCGPDGKCLIVKLPGDETWYVDSRALNCTMPNDTIHRCWVRHGEVPNITVDKNGNTCGAGAGSILMGKYHGFLRNGELTDC